MKEFDNLLEGSKLTKIENKLCLSCMIEHDVQIYEVKDSEVYKGKQVNFKAVYEYCENSDLFLEIDAMIQKKIIDMK